MWVPYAVTFLCVCLMGCGGGAPGGMVHADQRGPVVDEREAISLPAAVLAAHPDTGGDPARAARAIADEDWLAAQPVLTPEFGEYSPANEWHWAQLRREVRTSIGVPPDSPMPELVGRLLATQRDLSAGDTSAALAQLDAPIFRLGPDATLAALSDLPRYPHLLKSYAELRRNEVLGRGPNQTIYR